MSFKLSMNQKTTLSCYDQLPPGVSVNRSNRLLAKSTHLERTTSSSHYNSQSDLIYSDISSQNQKSDYKNLKPSSIFLLRDYARQIRHRKALSLRVRNLGHGSMINIMWQRNIKIMRRISTIFPYANIFKKYKGVMTSRQSHPSPLVRNIFKNSPNPDQELPFFNRHHPTGRIR